jgi:hypothetical protein
MIFAITAMYVDDINIIGTPEELPKAIAMFEITN